MEHRILPLLMLAQTACSPLQAQLDIEWQRCLGGTDYEYFLTVQPTSDGGYIAAGVTNSNNGDVSGAIGNGDVWVVKLSANGAIEWQRCLGGEGTDLANCIQQHPDGGYMLVGQTFSNDGDVWGNHGASDAWVAKLSSTGTLLWQRCLGGSDSDWANAIRCTSDGGYIVAGRTASVDGDVSGNHGSVDAWLVKLWADGTIAWQRCLGGSGFDSAASVALTTDGGYIFAGLTGSDDGDVSGHHGGEFLGLLFADGWVVKLSADGAIDWQRCLGGSDMDQVDAIEVTADGGSILTGYLTSTDGDVSGHHGNVDAFAAKLSATGTLEWLRCLGGTGNDYGASVKRTMDDGYILTGYTTSNDGDVSGHHGGVDEWGDPLPDAWVVKLFTDGTMDQQRCMGGTSYDHGAEVVQTMDGGYAMVGSTHSQDGDVSGHHGGSDMGSRADAWVVRLGAQVDVGEHAAPLFSILPNPCHGSVHIHAPNVPPTPFDVVDARGAHRFEGHTSPGTTLLDVSGWAKGLYLLTFRTEAGPRSQRLVVD